MAAIAAAKAKANFLSLLKEVEAKRESFTVTRNGRAVAKLVPMETEEDPLAVFHYPGLTVLSDIESPAFDADEWKHGA
jgi:prevent-host-death family protein